MPKKKFKETKVGQFLLGKSGVLDSLADVLPDKGLLGVVKNLIDKDETLPPPCLLYTSPSPRDRQKSRMPSSA